MKRSNIASLTLLTLSSLFSFSVNAKTLVIDDFLRYEDIDFDFSKPIPGMTKYESQFFIEGPFFPCHSGFGSYDKYEHVKKCKGVEIREDDVFGKKKHKAEFEQTYIQEFEQYERNVQQYIKEIDNVEIRNFFHVFEIRNYDIDSGIYKISWGDDFEIYEDIGFQHYWNGPLFYPVRNGMNRMYFNIGRKTRMSFFIPQDVAERIYNEGNLLIFNVKYGVTPDCLGGSVGGDGVSLSKQSFCDAFYVKDMNVEAVETNEFYNKTMLDYYDGFWRQLSEFMSNEDDRNALLASLRDKRVIYSTNEIKFEEPKID